MLTALMAVFGFKSVQCFANAKVAKKQIVMVFRPRGIRNLAFAAITWADDEEFGNVLLYEKAHVHAFTFFQIFKFSNYLYAPCHPNVKRDVFC